MKTTYKYLLLAGLVVLAASCEKEIEKESPADATTGKMITETISAQIEGETKATVDADAKFAWTVGDKIAVHVSSGEYIPTAGASVAANEANFAVTYVSGYTRDAFAIFPSNIVAPDAENYGQAGHTLDVTLPSTYPLAAVTGEKTPCPMIATNTPGAGWSFKQLCGLLRLTLNNLPPSTRSVTIGFNGQKVQGAFSIASPVSTDSFIETAPATGVDAGKDVITINTPSSFITGWTDGLVVNIPVPTGTYTNITVTSWTAANGAAGTGTATLTMTRPINWTVESSHGRKVAASLPAFSVAEGKKVVFAPGNLQYKASSDTWRFAEHQYDYVGDALNGNVYDEEVKSNNASISSSYSGWIDLFGWGTSGWDNKTVESNWQYYQPWSTDATLVKKSSPEESEWPESDWYTYYGPWDKDLTGDNANGDWGVLNTISGYTAGTWRMLTGGSTGEWNYLLSRVNSNSLATVVGVAGLIILPDAFTDPQTNTVGGGSFVIGANTTSSNVYTVEGWDAMVEAGAIFLPSAGWRKELTINNAGSKARYWSSSDKEGNHYESYMMNFDSGIYATNSCARYFGCAVRLVRDLN